MSKRAAVRVERLADIALDKPGMWLRVERRWWPDGSSCLHIAKWAVQPGTGRPAPWVPLQYLQVPARRYSWRVGWGGTESESI